MNPRHWIPDWPWKSPRSRTTFIQLAILVLFAAGGCDPLTLFYFLQPFEPTIKHPGPDLRNKSVAILAYAGLSTQFEYATIDADLSVRVAKNLTDNVRKIKVTPPEEVAHWRDEHAGTVNLPQALGEAFKTDYVVYLEVEKYGLLEQNSFQLYRGKANIHIQVFDMHKKGEVVYQEFYETEFPRTRPVTTSEMSRDKFQALFLTRLATELGWQFYDHEPGKELDNF